MIRNGQTESEGVRVYFERFSLFVAKRHKFRKIEYNKIFLPIN